MGCMVGLGRFLDVPELYATLVVDGISVVGIKVGCLMNENGSKTSGSVSVSIDVVAFSARVLFISDIVSSGMGGIERSLAIVVTVGSVRHNMQLRGSALPNLALPRPRYSVLFFRAAVNILSMARLQCYKN